MINFQLADNTFDSQLLFSPSEKIELIYTHPVHWNVKGFDFLKKLCGERMEAGYSLIVISPSATQDFSPVFRIDILRKGEKPRTFLSQQFDCMWGKSIAQISCIRVNNFNGIFFFSPQDRMELSVYRELVDSILKLKKYLNCELVYYFHDFFTVCPRLFLKSGQSLFCNPSPDVRQCQSCVKTEIPDLPQTDPDLDVAEWRKCSALFLTECTKLVFFSLSDVNLMDKILPGVISSHLEKICFLNPHPQSENPPLKPLSQDSNDSAGQFSVKTNDSMTSGNVSLSSMNISVCSNKDTDYFPDSLPSAPVLLSGQDPVISIGIPVYNPPEKAFPLMMRSVVKFAERYPAVEFLLHDDASTDSRIVPALKAWQQKYPHLIKIQLSDKNQGIHAARQAMVDAAAGRYYFNFDSDDLLLPFDAEKEVRYLDEHPSVVAAYSRGFEFSPESAQFTQIRTLPASDFYSLNAMTQSTNGAFFRMSALRACGGFSGYDDVEDDVGLYFKLSLEGDTELRPNPWSLIWTHPPHFWCHGTVETRQAMVARLIQPYEEELALLMKCEIPDDRPRLATKLTGALAFLQKISTQDILTLLRKLSVLNPSDYGCRSILCDYLTMTQQWEELPEAISKAVHDYRSAPWKLVAFHSLSQLAKQNMSQMFPQEFKEAFRNYNTLPAGLDRKLKEMLKPAPFIPEP